MKSFAKQVFRAATRCEAYWKLSDAEKLVWMIEKAYRLGREHVLRKYRFHDRSQVRSEPEERNPEL